MVYYKSIYKHKQLTHSTMHTRLLGFLCVAALMPVLVFAQAPAQDDSTNAPQAETVASFAVNVYNARYSEISADGRAYTLEFDLSNDGDVQPQVKYIVELHQKVGDDQYIIADQKAYDDTVSLAKGQTVHKKVAYAIPNTLVGDFRIMIHAANEKGMPYGAGIINDIVVSDAIAGLAVKMSDCFIAIDGDSEKYPLMTGTDINPDEHISLQCDKVTNTADFEIAFQPILTTHERTIFGKIIDEQKGAAKVIAAGATKSLKFPIATQQKPQAYQVAVILADAQGQSLTNTISVRYVVRGESATAQNITLDKDYYKKGDTAKVTAFISGNAHDFPGTRFEQENEKQQQQQDLILTLAVKDGSGTSCSETQEQKVNSQEGFVTTDIAITKDCQDPTVTLAVKNNDGTTLDESVFATESQQQTAAQSLKKAFSTQTLYYWVLAITALVVIMIIVRAMVKNKNTSRMAAFFLLIAATAFFTHTSDVHADSQLAKYFNLNTSSWANVTMTYNTNKVEYCAGEGVVASAAMTVNTCSNITGLHNIWINGQHVASNRYDFGSSHQNVTINVVPYAQAVLYLPVGRHDIPFRFLAQRDRNGKIITFTDSTYYKTVWVKDCSYCGDGAVNRAGEVCDNGANNGRRCVPGYGTSCSYCSTSCQPITVRGPFCGDGIKNGTEQCDGASGVPANYTCTPQCTFGAPQLGACAASGITTLKWNAAWPITFCANNTIPTPSPVKNPTYGETVTWDCPGLNGGTPTTNQKCKATRLAPGPGICNPAINTKTFATKPTTGLCCDPSITDRCVPSDAHINTITEQKDASGKITGWSWSCKGENTVLTDKYTQCNAICAPNTKVTISPNPLVIPSDSSTPIKLQAQMTSTGDCPESECILVADDFANIDGRKLTNNGTQELTFTMEEWAAAKSNNRGIELSCDGNVKIDDIFNPGNTGGDSSAGSGGTGPGSEFNTSSGISMYCLNRSCTSDGRCQASQKMGATSTKDCVQTCTSDVDCTNGRMIETRP